MLKWLNRLLVLEVRFTSSNDPIIFCLEKMLMQLESETGSCAAIDGAMVAVRTGGQGAGGVSVLLIPADLAGDRCFAGAEAFWLFARLLL